MSPKSKAAAFLSAVAFAFAALPAAAQSDIQWDRSAPPAYNQNARDPYRPLPEARLFSPREVEALVAPIALFPDSLVAQILMAATYPYDVEDAANWVADPRNSRLVGYELSNALDDMDWDPSVKALTSAPDVLRMMDERRDWTANLGQAFTADQGMVMDAVQHLRRQASAAGRLYSDRYRRILDRGGEIIIEPVSADEMYFQFYDPRVAYGAWAYDDYPPYYFPPQYYQVVRPIPIFGPLWGWSSWDWRGRSLHLDVNRWRALDHNRSHVIVGNTWHHDNTRNRDRTFRSRPDRTNFNAGARTPDGRGFGDRSGGSDRNNTGGFRGRENGIRDNRDNNAGTDNRGGREGGRGFQRRQPEAPLAPSANATPTPQPGAPRGGFRDRGFGEGNPNRGFREQANREPASPTVTQPAPGQPNTRQFNEGRFNRGEFNGDREGRGEGGGRGRQRREEANVAPPVATPQPRTFAPPPTAAPAYSPPGGRYRGDRPEGAGDSRRAEVAQPRGGRFGQAPPNAVPPAQPQAAPAPAAQPQPKKDDDNNPRRGRGRGGDDRPSR